jgi:hypothetical protein
MRFFRVVEGEPTPRNQLLRAVYHKWHAAMAEGRPDVAQRIATSGECFNEYWQPFGSRAHHHADFTSWLEKSGRPLLLSPRQQQDRRRPYHIDLELMVKLTTRSCELEGSSMSEQDVSVVGRSIAESGIPTFHLAWDCGGALPSPPRELRQKLDFRSAVHISEAYFHMLALNLGQGLLLPRDTFYVTEREFLRLHEVLMYPFHDKSPGKYRSLPIRVTDWDLACFPYPQELPGLMPRYFKWLETPPEGGHVHPFLRGCDVALTTAHLHPFADGNGRMARLLSSLAMAHGGSRPTLLQQMPRHVYQRAVHDAQHCGNVVEFYKTCLGT